MVPGVPSGDRGNWDKNRGVTSAMHMFCEESLGNDYSKDVELLRSRSVHKLDRLKALIILEQVNTSVGKKRRILMSKPSIDW